MTHRFIVCTSLAALALMGCGSVGEPRVGETGQAVVNGEPVTEGFEYVVQVFTPSDSCTGTLIARDIVILNRHCIAEEQTVGLLDCDPNDPFKNVAVLGQSAPDIKVYLGYKAVTGGEEPDARVAEVFVSGDANFCTHDIALLRLDKALDVEPPPIKLDDGDDPLEPGEMLTLAGFGVIDAKATTTDKLLKKDLELYAIGPSFYTQDPWPEFQLAESLIFGGPGACIGDSGAPLIRKKTGAMVSFVHLLYNLDFTKAGVNDFTKPWTICEGDTAALTGVDLRYHKDLIDKAFEASEYAPHLEGRPAPSALGGTCELDVDCHTSLCVEVGGAKSCSQDCSSEACPAGFTCASGANGVKYCLEGSAAAPESGDDGGCAIRPADQSRFAWSALLAGALGVVLLRRRRARR